MTPEELAAAVAADEIDTVVVGFTDHYGRLLGQRFDADFFLEVGLTDGTHACDYLLTVDMEMEPTPGYEYASWEQGYGDFHLVPDRETLRRAGWTDRTAVVLCDVHQHDHTPTAVAPRSMLRCQIERLADRGFTARVASELEFFLYDDAYRTAHDKGYADLRPAGWYIEDYHLLQGARVEPFVGAVRRALRASDIPVETTKGEWGRGQHEINVRHAEALAMADRHVLMKHGMKELADREGVGLTFMAKPHSADAGSSCHLHVSLWNEEGANVFAESDEVFSWFLGGWLAHVDDFMACYAPTINSYKRYVDGSWAPTRIAWSHDNRTAGFRVVGVGSSKRIECRIPGADCNPYVAYAASLAAGLRGIDERIDAPPEFVGDVYQSRELPRVPRTLEHATVAFRASAVAREAFGDDVVDHYAHFHDIEVDAFHASVTDWERTRYFERI